MKMPGATITKTRNTVDLCGTGFLYAQYHASEPNPIDFFLLLLLLHDNARSEDRGGTSAQQHQVELRNRKIT